jgi:hypothetical protein
MQTAEDIRNMKLQISIIIHPDGLHGMHSITGRACFFARMAYDARRIKEIMLQGHNPADAAFVMKQFSTGFL